MCFAPRCINGTMARPCSPCRNTASLPATPCASITAPQAAAMSSVQIRRRRRLLLTLISFMAGIAGLVDDFADGQNPGGILFLRRGHRGVRRIAQRDGKLGPVAAVDGAVA